LAWGFSVGKPSACDIVPRLQPSLVVTYNEAVSFGAPAGDVHAPRPSLAPRDTALSFRAERAGRLD
jgi:hypothetical protein